MRSCHVIPKNPKVAIPDRFPKTLLLPFIKINFLISPLTSPAMSSVYPSRSANAVPTPPITPPKKSVVLADLDLQNAPADMDIPDNYVSHTLKTQKPLPPVDWQNWYHELNWLNVAILTLVPIIGITGACFTKLRWETALFSIFYYYVTGLGPYPPSWYSLKLFSRSLWKKASLQDTTDSGHTAPTTRQNHCSTSSLRSAQAQSRVPLNGGLGVTVHTIATLTQILIRTTLTAAFCGLMSAGWSSNLAASRA
jgi:hypothetical protein